MKRTALRRKTPLKSKKRKLAKVRKDTVGENSV